MFRFTDHRFQYLSTLKQGVGGGLPALFGSIGPGSCAQPSYPTSSAPSRPD